MPKLKREEELEGNSGGKVPGFLMTAEEKVAASSHSDEPSETPEQFAAAIDRHRGVRYDPEYEARNRVLELEQMEITRELSPASRYSFKTGRDHPWDYHCFHDAVRARKPLGPEWQVLFGDEGYAEVQNVAIAPLQYRIDKETNRIMCGAQFVAKRPQHVAQQSYAMHHQRQKRFQKLAKAGKLAALNRGEKIGEASESFDNFGAINRKTTRGGARPGVTFTGTLTDERTGERE